MRHSWTKVEEDLRRSMTERRPVLYRCSNCGTYRASYRYDTCWRTFYGEPYQYMTTKAYTCEAFTRYKARLALSAAGS